MFEDIRLVHFHGSKEPFRILREVNSFFNNYGRLFVWQYYDLLGREAPPEANDYVWLTNEAFTFGRDFQQGYFIKADEPIRIIDTTPTEEVE